MKGKAIETEYKGYRFRSRLEARWAVFLDALGLQWEYEKEGYDLGKLGYYLPDFWLPWSKYSPYPGSGYFVEIKGREPTDDEIAKLRALAAQTNHSSWLFVGVPGAHKRYTAHRTGNFFFCDPLAEYIEESNPYDAYTFDLWCHFSRWDGITPEHMEDAIVAARSARFEHGEHGR